ncbi:general secretion pathway protein GspB [Ferrimonas sp. SCSIO 43195]|uniref:general secretion pathway protein GspB n=1 Tax=Ferrimonas sp. SCSIO 43195 TaxID=2822844 RepID=UPI002075C1C6|nr:general secretion pathway protein GspB [Ferrimonas sp. SCSIO 43195]USD37029.1 general secretion pathway protein GspB [Ferrimonas sp. SCSIO 43195]
MSYLLDAVGREKQQQGQLDATVAVPLAPKSALPWHFAWPLAGALTGAVAMYAVLALQPVPEIEAPAQVAAEVVRVKQVAMPIPVAFDVAPEPEPEPVQYLYQPEQQRMTTEVSQPAAPTGKEVRSDAAIVTEPEVVASTPAEVSEPANAKLLAAFEQAVADLDLAEPAEEPAVEPTPVSEPEATSLSAEALMAPKPAEVASQQPTEAPKLGTLPWAFQKGLPDINITAHVYSSDADNRWLRANGRELQEGDAVAPGVTLKEIRPNEVILEKAGQAFSVPALGQL